MIVGVAAAQARNAVLEVLVVIVMQRHAQQSVVRTEFGRADEMSLFLRTHDLDDVLHAEAGRPQEVIHRVRGRVEFERLDLLAHKASRAAVVSEKAAP